MTSILESAISIIAPHTCISCSNERNILCETCFFDVFSGPHEACFLCDIPTKDSRVCPACAPKTAIRHVWMAGTYDELRRVLIRAFKFERKQAAFKPLARAMTAALPYLDGIVVVPVPTAPVRVRVRGYDQAALLAKAIAKENGWCVSPALRRLHSGRQVGSTRARRFAQAARAYQVTDTGAVRGKHILLVDDVTTSGATLEAAAELLHAAGAETIDAVVAAKHTLTSA
jgi:ComF family protein